MKNTKKVTFIWFLQQYACIPNIVVLICTVFMLNFSALPVQAQDDDYVSVESLSEAERFRLYNPNIHKYLFTRSFISSLSYFHRMSQRLRQQDPAQEDYEKDHEMPQAFLEALVADNLDLRVAKGYLKKYRKSPNQFINKVADEAVNVYQSLIDVNEQEQLLWEKLYRARREPEFHDFDYDTFDQNLRKVLHQRVVVLRRLPEVASMAAKVMLSERAEELGYGYHLGLTKKERQLLVEKLDEYAEDNLAWGMREGQSSVEASIAIIREMLEDPVYSALDEK